MFNKTIFTFSIMCALAFGIAAQETTPAPLEPSEPTTPITPATTTMPTTADVQPMETKEVDNGVVTTKSRYRLQPSDVLDIRYVYSPEYDRKGIIVQPDGFVSLELVGNVRVAGLTLEEAREKIRKIAAEHLNEPEVVLILTDFVRPYFVVAGEVPTPGRVELRDNISALQAVMLAGGFKETAKGSQIILFRRYNAELVETKVIKLNDLRKDGSLREDEMLQAGDMIYVPRSNISKIERYARLASVVSIFGFLLR